MPGILAESWAESHRGALVAITVVVVAALMLFILDRYVAGRLDRIIDHQGLGAKSTTRLRFAWRVFQAAIATVAAAIALQQFADLDRVANALLASSAIAAVVVGFAARPVIANAVAGISLAVSQPLRIGDLVTFEGETGVVEDVRLTCTWLRTLADARIVIPNERLASGILRNDSIGSPTVAIEVSIWLAADVDETVALDAVHALDGVRARIAESSPDGHVRLLVIGPPGAARERQRLEADLRRDALQALRQAGAR